MGERIERHAAARPAGPPLRPGIVDRPSLVDSLMSASHVDVVLVSAPAGYGKTTVLALWRNRDPRDFAWLTLEARDDDPAVFVQHLAAALSPVAGMEVASLAGLNAPEPHLDAIVDSLTAYCGEAVRPFVLVLDDLHQVTEPRCHALIRSLAERLPAGSQCAIATRTDPNLPLASWRAHGRMIELRAAELSLGETEARALFDAAGVPLADGLVCQLVKRTEGWPAALYLAALSLRDRARPDDFVARFAGTSRHVADFLSEDVLARLPEDKVAFLLQTSVLEELTPSLCETLTGVSDAQQMLRKLERRNLFVVPLDEDRFVYRYHHLFAQYLRAELVRRSPEIVLELHRRAWRWYREQGVIDRTIIHAQTSGDMDIAAELVAARWRPMVECGQIETVRQWINGFEDEQIQSHAPLAVAAAWIFSLTGDVERATRYAEAARKGKWDGQMPDGTASLESALGLMSSAFGFGDVSAMTEAARAAVALEPKFSPWRGLASLLLGIARVLEGNFPAARAALNDALQVGDGNNATDAVALSQLALVHLFEGDEGQAFDCAMRAHVVVDRPGMRRYMPSVGPYAVSANLLARRGNLEAAARACDRALELLPSVTRVYWWQMIETRILLAPVLAALDRADAAAARLSEAQELLLEHPDSGHLLAWHEETLSGLRLRRRPEASQELSDAERRVARLLASDLSLSEIGRQLYISANTVKTHKRSIYRKLGVSSRVEAVRAARIRPA